MAGFPTANDLLINEGTLRLGRVGESDQLSDGTAVSVGVFGGAGDFRAAFDIGLSQERIGSLHVGQNGVLVADLVAGGDVGAIGNSGRLVVSGEARFDTGSRVELRPGAGGYLEGQSYRILRAEGGIVQTGPGGIVFDPDQSPFVSLQTSVQDNDIVVNVLADGNVPASVLYARVGENAQQQAVGAAIGALADQVKTESGCIQQQREHVHQCGEFDRATARSADRAWQYQHAECGRCKGCL